MTVISKETIDLLQNFSTINKSIVIKPGNQIETLSLNKNILAKAKVQETFDRDMAIYDLPSLISLLIYLMAVHKLILIQAVIC